MKTTFILFTVLMINFCLPTTCYSKYIGKLPTIDWSKVPRKELEGTDWSKLSELEVREYLHNRRIIERESDLEILKFAKLALINGNPLKAKFLLRKINDLHTKVGIVKIRYLALINFLLEDYEQSYILYNDVKLNKKINYPHICQMKLLMRIATNRLYKLEEEFSECNNSTFDYIKNDYAWPIFMMNIALKDRRTLSGRNLGEVSSILPYDDLTQMWLKMGIYLGLEKDMAKQVSLIPLERFKSNETRELLSLIYYRTGNYKRAFNLVEDINSPNANNIMGNIYLRDRKYELAFGHFKLALKKKLNSLNALERAIPLSWILGTYREGLDLLELKVSDEVDFHGKLALSAAFKLQLGMFKEADRDIDHLINLYQGIPPKELSIIATYSALVNYKSDELSMHSSRACRRMYDGLSCWLKTQSLIWDDVVNRISQDSPTYPDKKLTVEWLTDSSIEVEPIEEEIIINQDEIIRLDEELSRNKKAFYWP